MDQDNSLNDSIIVKIEDDKMRAFVNVLPPLKRRAFTEDEIIAKLHENGVKFGINKEKIAQICEKKLYGINIEAAAGKPCTDGENGYFKYYFNTEVESGPKVLKDGSIDYTSMKDYEKVEEGQVVVQYIPPTQGEFGSNVLGHLNKPKPGRNLPILKGKGFVLSEDHCTYKAALNGKIEFKNDRLLISDLYEVNSDVDLLTGNINFTGDVLIHGAVISGMTITATGNVVVEGSVEAAIIVAGKDIILKRGMQGNGKGKLESGGNISGKFFEAAAIKTRGKLEANSLLNCNVDAGVEVVVDGKYGLIIGGCVRATKQVTATGTGNSSELYTQIDVGINKEMLEQYNNLEKDIQKVEAEIKLIEKSLSIFERMEKKNEGSNEVNPKKVQIFRAKIIKSTELQKYNEEKQKLLLLMDSGASAMVYVRNTVYANTRITIDSNTVLLKEDVKNVTFKIRDSKVVMFSNSGDFS